MLIGNRWVENTRLRVLNANDNITSLAWTRFAGGVQTQVGEKGIIVGITTASRGAPGQELWLQLETDGRAMHDGYLRVNICSNNLRDVNLQPAQMQMPHLDVQENEFVTVSGRLDSGIAGIMGIDLYVVTYYLEDYKRAGSVAFPGAERPVSCV